MAWKMIGARASQRLVPRFLFSVCLCPGRVPRGPFHASDRRARSGLQVAVGSCVVCVVRPLRRTALTTVSCAPLPLSVCL